MTLGDHPRSRGNNFGDKSVTFSTSGSPPLAREQPFESQADAAGLGITPARAGTTHGRAGKTGVSGITPARAGTTNFVIRGFDAIRDHPRSRGNNIILYRSG